MSDSDFFSMSSNKKVPISIFLRKNVRFQHFCLKMRALEKLCVTKVAHCICFEQKYVNSQVISTENCHFYSSEKSLYIAWAWFRNEQQGKTKRQTLCG